MAEIRPFRGLRFDPTKVGELAAVTSPPYDVISPEAQQAYYSRSPYNVIRLELGLDRPGGSPAQDKYRRAAQLFREWRRQGILRREARPAFYIYEQGFPFRGPWRVRRGLIAALRLEEWERGIVLPHEETLPGPKADRLRLMRACRANFSPIFGLYEDPTATVRREMEKPMEERPLIDLVDEAGERHRLWAVLNRQAMGRVARALADQPIYIADGHHRYETALRYRDERRRRCPRRSGDEAFLFVLTVLSDLHDPGLVVLPTHRLVSGLPETRLASLLERLGALFCLEKRGLGDGDSNLSALLAEMARRDAERPTCGLYGLGPGQLVFLTLRDEAKAKRLMPPQRSEAWKALDVSILQVLFIEHLLGIEGRQLENHIAYTRDEQEALHGVRQGRYQLALFLNPPQVAQIKEVAQAGDRLPHKSTYFHPKLLTGMVINPLAGRLPNPLADKG